jgi:hypothetical protein
MVGGNDRLKHCCPVKMLTGTTEVSILYPTSSNFRVYSVSYWIFHFFLNKKVKNQGFGKMAKNCLSPAKKNKLYRQIKPDSRATFELIALLHCSI